MACDVDNFLWIWIWFKQQVPGGPRSSNRIQCFVLAPFSKNWFDRSIRSIDSLIKLDLSMWIRLELPGPLGDLAVWIECKCFVSAPFSIVSALFSIEKGAETIESGAESIENRVETIENGAVFTRTGDTTSDNHDLGFYFEDIMGEPMDWS